MSFSVRGRVSIDQSQSCQEPVLTYTDAFGDVTTHYALLSWREIYAMYLFSSEEERAEYRDSVDLDSSVPVVAFIQDFGNGAPDKQCVYYGSFTSPIDGGGDMIGTLGRNPDLKWNVGDTLTEEEAPSNQNCPQGYPRQWDSTAGPHGDNTGTSRADNALVRWAMLLTGGTVVGLLKSALTW